MRTGLQCADGRNLRQSEAGYTNAQIQGVSGWQVAQTFNDYHSQSLNRPRQNRAGLSQPTPQHAPVTPTRSFQSLLSLWFICDIAACRYCRPAQRPSFNHAVEII